MNPTSSHYKFRFSFPLRDFSAFLTTLACLPARQAHTLALASPRLSTLVSRSLTLYISRKIGVGMGFPLPHSLTHLFLLILIPLLLLFSNISTFALEQAGRDIAILKIPTGVRALGMGSAFTAIADDANAPSWNAAGMAQINQASATIMQTRLSTDADYYYVSYVQPIVYRGVSYRRVSDPSPSENQINFGTVGISWTQIALGDINQTAKTVEAHNEVQRLGTFSYFSNAYMLSYGYQLFEKLSLGITGTYLSSDMTGISGGQAWGYSISPGLLYKATQNLSLALKADGIVNSQKWGTDTVETVPTKMRLGIGYKIPDYGLTLTSDISQIMKSGYSSEYSFGTEWSLGQYASLRVGYTESNWTAGAGFRTETIGVDYAYVSQRALSKDNVHRVALTGYW